MTFPAPVEFTHRGYPVTGYRVQDIGIATRILFMHPDTDYQTVPAMRGEDSGRSVYNQDRSIFLHFRPEMVGSGGERCRVIAPGRHHS